MTLDQTLVGIVMVLAVLAGPILALYIQNRLNIRRETRDRKLWVFKTLMAARELRLSPEHVTALNMLDVEFYGDDKENREVIRCWNMYRDHLRTDPEDPNDPRYQEKSAAWAKDGLRLFYQLLDKVAKAVGYDF